MQGEKVRAELTGMFFKSPRLHLRCEPLGLCDKDWAYSIGKTRTEFSKDNLVSQKNRVLAITADGTVVTTDDGPRAGVTLDAVSQLNPVFRPDGRVTAGNACPLNDGAAAVVVMSRKRAEELGITPLARIIASSVSALNPEIMGLGPIEAIKRVMARANMTMSDIDLVEINEAFAAQVIPSADELGIDMVNQLNVNGGAIALGHPFGQTGARIMTTLINGLQDSDGTFGLESMCVGGGQGMAMVIERLN